MAIEMIEQNELAALCSSRVGSKSFINDDKYANLFGSKTAKRNREARIREITAKYAVDPVNATNCDYLVERLVAAQNELEMFRKTFKGRVEQAYIDGLESVVADYKTRIAQNKCEEKKVAAEKEAEQQQNIALTEKIASSTQIELPAEEGKASRRQKYLIYGVGGLFALIAVYVLLKPKK